MLSFRGESFFFLIVGSAYDGDASELDLGDEVEYTLTRKSAKISAENIRRVTKGTVAPEVSEGCILNLSLSF